MVTHTMTYSFKWVLHDEPSVWQVLQNFFQKVAISEEIADHLVAMLESSESVEIFLLILSLIAGY